MVSYFLGRRDENKCDRRRGTDTGAIVLFMTMETMCLRDSSLTETDANEPLDEGQNASQGDQGVKMSVAEAAVVNYIISRCVLT